MDTRHVFLDTDFFLQYAAIEQIDWLKELKCDYVVLVIAPVVIRQLNEKKDSPNSRRLRERAGTALKRLHEFSERSAPVMIKDGVELYLQPTEPQIDFAARRLSLSILDDWLVASIFEFLDQSHVSVVLITGDLGLKIKARNQGIQCTTLPEKFRLRSEQDPSEKRIRELEEKVRQFETRMPLLELIFEGDTNRCEVALSKNPDVTEEMIRNKMEEIRCQYPKLDTAFELHKQELAGPLVNAIQPEEFENYNLRIAKFWIAYEKYLRECAGYLDSLQRRVKLDILLKNVGGCPAEGIDIYMHFPDGMDVQALRELPSPPEKPNPPMLPKGPLDKIADVVGHWSLASALSGNLESLLKPPDLSGPSRTIFSNVGNPTIRRSNSYEVHVSLRTLKHHFRESVCELYITFPSWESVTSFGIDYSIVASNIPDRISGKLHVIVK